VPVTVLEALVNLKRRCLARLPSNLKIVYRLFFSLGISQSPFLRVGHLGRKSVGTCRAIIDNIPDARPARRVMLTVMQK
jgi:hypothetical protein